MDEAIQQLRFLLTEAKMRIFHAEKIIDAIASENHFLAKNYVEKHHKEILALRSEFEKIEPPTSVTDESSNGPAHDADGRSL